MTQATPTTAPFGGEQTSRHSDRASEMPYDDKDNMGLLRETLSRKKKPIYAGLAFLCVVVIGVSIAVSTSNGTDATTQSGYTEQTKTTPAPASSTADDSATAGVHGADLTVASGSGSASSTAGSTSSAASDASVAGEASLEEAGVGQFDSSSSGNTTAGSSTTTPAPTTPQATTVAPTSAPVTTNPPTQAPTSAPSGPALPYKALDFNWKDPSNWEYANGNPVAAGMVGQDGIKLTSANSPTPIRTKQGWGGEKIVYIEWERSASSDTNIWMLNTKLQNQFGVGNGWPYWGELDIFEMFTQDKSLQPQYDFSGFGGFSDVSSYGQLTLHNGPRKENGDPCFCPASHTKSAWYQNSAPMTSGCTAQFSSATKSMATIWGSDGNGQYLQLYQNPTITTGGKVNGVQTYDITPGGTTTMKIYNNKELFWGTPASAPCAAGGGHNAATGFPFFEDFRLILEEQKKNDGSAWFKVNNIQIFKK